MKNKIILPIYYTQVFKTKKPKTFLVGFNWYRNAHFFINNEVKREYHTLIKKQIGNKKFKKIKLIYNVYLQRLNSDGANVRSVIEKYFQDGLVEAGAIEDDNIKFVLGETSEYFLDKDNPRIEIEIIEIK